MNDLVARLLAAIEETELLAHSAWHFQKWVAVKNSDSNSWRIESTVRHEGDQDWYDREHGSFYGEGNAEHAARNDPSSVLRRCAADRRRLERHAPAEPGIGHFPSARFKDPDARICAHCSHDGDWGAAVWPCLDFTDLMDSYGLTDQQEGETRG